jgi:hypothetical protein
MSKVGGMTQVIEHLPSEHEALSSNHHTAKRRKKEEREEGREGGKKGKKKKERERKKERKKEKCMSIPSSLNLFFHSVFLTLECRLLLVLLPKLNPTANAF